MWSNPQFLKSQFENGRISVGCRPGQTVNQIQWLNHQKCKFVNLWICKANLGTL